MIYITSRGSVLPTTSSDFEATTWYNLWKKPLWPYDELAPGDTLYWYESPSGKIVWETEIVNVGRFAYSNKAEAAERICGFFGLSQLEPERCFEAGPDVGVCLAYRARPIRRLHLPRPHGFRFPQRGWMWGTNDVAAKWLASADEAITPSSIASMPLGELRKAAFAAASPGSEGTVQETTQHFYERSETVRQYVLTRAKGVCEVCRNPAPFVRLDGTPYLEPHHIQQLSDGGPDDPRTVGAVCPNCHREAHYGVNRDTLNKRLAEYVANIECAGPV